MLTNEYRVLLVLAVCLATRQSTVGWADEMWDVDAAREANIRKISENERVLGEPFVFVTFPDTRSATIINDRLVETINRYTHYAGEITVRRRMVDKAVVDEDWEYAIPGAATYRLRTGCFGSYDAAKAHLANVFLLVSTRYHPPVVFGGNRIGNVAFAGHLRGFPDKPHVSVALLRGNTCVHLYIPQISRDGTPLEHADVKEAPDVRAVAYAIDQHLLADPLDNLSEETKRSRKTVTLAIDGTDDVVLGKNYEFSFSAAQGETTPCQIRLRVSRGEVSARAKQPG